MQEEEERGTRLQGPGSWRCAEGGTGRRTSVKASSSESTPRGLNLTLRAAPAGPRWVVWNVASLRGEVGEGMEDVEARGRLRMS